MSLLRLEERPAKNLGAITQLAEQLLVPILGDGLRSQTLSRLAAGWLGRLLDELSPATLTPHYVGRDRNHNTSTYGLLGDVLHYQSASLTHVQPV